MMQFCRLFFIGTNLKTKRPKIIETNLKLSRVLYCNMQNNRRRKQNKKNKNKNKKTTTTTI